MRSLTGFGIGDAPLGDGRVVAEVRSVNHRFLEVRVRAPRELADLSLFAEQVLRERLRRGRVELGLRLEGAALAAATLDRARAKAAFVALRELRDELAPGAELPLSLLAAVPDLFSPPSGPELDTTRDAVRRAVVDAVIAMDAMRVREGSALAADLAERAAALRTLSREVADRAAGATETIRARLRERLDRLLDEPSAGAARAAGFDAGRLEGEIALLADRSDVSEELTRLASHLAHWDAIIAESEEGTTDVTPVGRRLDFLLQEMVRETNTLGAKAQDAGISQRVVAMKAELERLREQVQNVE